MKLSVVIPVYNEVNTIEELVSRVSAVPLDKEIIIVDDGSKDGTREKFEGIRLRHQEVKIILHEKNKGKGAALRTGFSQAIGDVVVVQDADLEYDPREYPKLLEPIADGRADVVYGSRFLGGPHRVMYFWHYLGNQLLTLMSNMLTNINLTDMETCFKMFKREVLQDIRLRSDSFGFEPEFTAQVAKKHFRIYEVPISYSGRTYEEGKKIGLKDVFIAVYFMFRARFFVK
jgi:glycosyltransferase involved in cell wall biosynthesis